MELKGKALFNFLKVSWLEDPTLQVKSWQVEDLSKLSIEELFKRLKQLAVILEEESFYLYAENCYSPEELVECVWIDEEDLEGHDQAYLLLFELWRRLLPGKLCLSVFCDELDQLIELYDGGELEDEEPLQNALQVLEDILDDAVDQEGNPQEVFATVAPYCAHDLEHFLFDYISDQIVENNETYASELVEAFYEFVAGRKRFDFLRSHLIALSNPDESNRIYERMLEELGDDPDLEVLLQVAMSLVHHGDVRLFMKAVKQAVPLLTTEVEFQNLLTMTAEYFRCLDRDQEAKSIHQLLETRSQSSLSDRLDPAALSQFINYIK